MPSHNLQHLIGAYFYELWDQHEYSTWEDAVDDFVRRSPERAGTVPDEIAQFLTDGLSDEELAAQLTTWGFDFDPREGERAWLAHVADRIRTYPAA